MGGCCGLGGGCISGLGTTDGGTPIIVRSPVGLAPGAPSSTLASLPKRADVHVAQLDQDHMVRVLLEWISEMIMQAIQEGEDYLERVSITGRERRRRG